MQGTESEDLNSSESLKRLLHAPCEKAFGSQQKEGVKWLGSISPHFMLIMDFHEMPQPESKFMKVHDDTSVCKLRNMQNL